MAWTRLAHMSDLHGDGPFALSADGVDVVVLRAAPGPAPGPAEGATEGTTEGAAAGPASAWRAYGGRCPHQGALLGEGELDGDTLVCRNHRWRFDRATGQRRGGPGCLAACPLVRRGDELWVDVASLGSAQRAAHGPGARPARTLDDLPGPRPMPVLGNMLQLDPARFHQRLEHWAARYGDVYLYRLASTRIVAISRAELIEQILRDRPETYRRAPNLAPIFRELGVDGLFSAEGEAWRPQRRLAMQALSHRHLKGFYPRLADVARRLRRRWEAKARSGEPIDVVDEMKRFTVDVTTMLVFGRDVDTIGRDDDAIQRRLGHVFPAFNRRLFSPIATWRWIRMPADRRVDRAIAELRAWLRELVAETRARLAAEAEHGDPGLRRDPENFLESMLAARDADGKPFDDEVIFGNAMTMLLAGEDTTAYTLAWAVHHLCDLPDAAARLRAEADALGTADGVPADIDAAGRLTYAAAVANETMRVRPVAPITMLSANRDVVLGDVAAPRGTWIALLTRPPALGGEHFGDPAAFRPERWLDERPVAPHEPGAHMPFGSGPRICPGRTLALLEMRLVLSMLHASFDVARVGEAAGVRERFAFTMHPVGLSVRLQQRADGMPAPLGD